MTDTERIAQLEDAGPITREEAELQLKVAANHTPGTPISLHRFKVLAESYLALLDSSEQTIAELQSVLDGVEHSISGALHWNEEGKSKHLNSRIQYLCNFLLRTEGARDELRRQLLEAKRCADDAGEIVGISGENLDALICGIGDKALEIADQRDELRSQLQREREVSDELAAAVTRKLADCLECKDAALMPGEYCSDECVALSDALAQHTDLRSGNGS